ICPHCKEAYKPSSLELSYFNEKPEVLYRGKGCDRCRKTGYLGRTGIFELLIIDNEIRSMVTEKIDAQKIKTFAVSKGIKTLRMDGLNKVLEGTTTLEEVLRVTQKDYADISI
ncbi:MAG: type II secretion system protein GspE, partial [Campylobacterota bacterium]|nr:type II secretion system protein GspE [Campylobacterota bacterium]